MKHEQLSLFTGAPARAEPRAMPDGFRYAPDVIDAADEQRLVAAFADLPFREFEFHGFLGKPDFLIPLRERAAAFAGLEPDRLPHALVTEYQPGVSIGWHRDRPHYDDVIGVSLLSPCTFRLRRKHGASWQRATLRLAPRSIYLMRGPSRDQWQHSIPAVDALRYSVTFRSLRTPAAR